MGSRFLGSAGSEGADAFSADSLADSAFSFRVRSFFFRSRLRRFLDLLSPDFSTYADMNLWRQIESVAKNRWCGAFWQSKGLTVIPTISWSTPRSYDFCFDGIEKSSIVAIGMIGCKSNKTEFLRGYNTMLEKIAPEAIICFGEPFDEMAGKIIPIDYHSSRKVVR